MDSLVDDLMQVKVSSDPRSTRQQQQVVVGGSSNRRRNNVFETKHNKDSGHQINSGKNHSSGHGKNSNSEVKPRRVVGDDDEPVATAPITTTTATTGKSVNRSLVVQQQAVLPLRPKYTQPPPTPRLTTTGIIIQQQRRTQQPPHAVRYTGSHYPALDQEMRRQPPVVMHPTRGPQEVIIPGYYQRRRQSPFFPWQENQFGFHRNNNGYEERNYHYPLPQDPRYMSQQENNDYYPPPPPEPRRVLPLTRFMRDDEKIPIFSAHKTLFRCMLSRFQRIVNDADPPVVSEKRMENLDQLLGVSLKKGWKESDILSDYTPLRELKAYALTSCIRREAVFDFVHDNNWRNKNKGLPFVGFAGIVVSIMRMPLDVDNHVVVHTWIDGPSTHIRLMRGKESGDQEQGKDAPNNARHHRNILMRRLTRDSAVGDDEDDADADGQEEEEEDEDDPPVAAATANNKTMFEQEKHFKFSRIKFGKHVLVMMSEVNAVDEKGDDIKILTRYDFPTKSVRDEWLMRRFSEIWAHASLVKQTKILTAVRDKSATVVEMSVLDARTDSMMQEMERMLTPGGGDPNPDIKRGKWEPKQLLDFLDRFLFFVQEELTSAPEGRVVSFRCVKGRTRQLTAFVQDERSSNGIKRHAGSSGRRRFTPSSGGQRN